VRCPTCKKTFAAADTQTPPFCSARCRQIDLGRWLSEENSVPAKSLEIEDLPEEAEPHDPDDDES
jgi:endogenous inhibitor of DNA gyrase (YacG/DUF329 family)